MITQKNDHTEAAPQRDQLLELERQLAVERDTNVALRDELAREQRSAQAARELAGASCDYRRADVDVVEVVTPRYTDEYVQSLERELEAMRSTKLFRWTRPLRRLYGAMRATVR